MATDTTAAERRMIMVFPFECPVCGHKTNMPQTNADRIRAMSDEELADLINREISYCAPTSGDCEKTSNDCKACWLDWLKQPAEEG